MTEQTIYLDNPREAHHLIGNEYDLVKRMEEILGVSISSREAWIRVSGEEAEVERGIRFFKHLQVARNRGLPLDELFIVFALECCVNNQEEELHNLIAMRIDVSPSRPPVFPRTFGQQRYIQAIRATDISFGIGPAGTGKTFLAIAMAVAALHKQLVSRIILTRPAIEAGETLGFLPGDMHQKIFPYLRPLYDALHDVMTPADIDRHMSRGVIEVAPLAYMRGRTLNSAFVILDEAQNTTQEQMLMFLTRLGFDSKCVITGDLTQIDLPNHKASGLKEARHMLKHIKGLSFSEFTEADVVRHPLVQKIIRAYRDGRIAAPAPSPTASPEASQASGE